MLSYLTLGALLGFSNINWTIIMSVTAVCLTAMGVLIKVFGIKEDPEKYTKLKDIINSIQTEIAKLTVKNENMEKSIDDVKQDYRTLANKLDDLLKQLIDLLS